MGDAKEVAADLERHEAVCEERWGSLRREFAELKGKIDKFFWAMLACAVSVIGTLVLTLMKTKGLG